MSDPDIIKNNMYAVNLEVWEPGRFSEGLYEFTLKSNGLKVLLYPIRTGKRVVSVNVSSVLLSTSISSVSSLTMNTFTAI